MCVCVCVCVSVCLSTEISYLALLLVKQEILATSAGHGQKVFCSKIRKLELTTARIVWTFCRTCTNAHAFICTQIGVGLDAELR